MARARRGIWIHGVLGVLALLAMPAFLHAGEREDASSPFSREKTSGAVTLKSGQTIENIRVVGFTTIDYIVEVYEGVYIRLPRGQVVSVESEAWVNSSRERPRENREPSVLLPGRRISPQLNARLNRRMVVERVEYEQADFLDVFDDIEEFTGASFEMAPELEQLPEEDREWRVTLDPGDTLLTLLQDKFASSFPEVEVVYGYDHVLLRLPPDAADENEDTSSPPFAEQPHSSANGPD